MASTGQSMSLSASSCSWATSWGRAVAIRHPLQSDGSGRPRGLGARDSWASTRQEYLPGPSPVRSTTSFPRRLTLESGASIMQLQPFGGSMEKRFGAIAYTMTAHVSALNSMPLPLATKLHYGVDNPYAVTLSIGPSAGPPVTWSFARELLTEGLRRPTGPGDVLVLPRCSHHPHSMRIVLNNRHGTALVKLVAAEVAAFLRKTLSLVPAGTEADYLDIDGAITALMGRSHHL
ncbi:SsgA family sporulation/cell division regulator [Streptomyces lancefieldiae]|uniref:SsgA family sporulation/cell division regulator n=1 Tax=Streptomyces lancefieldiae TaxID=3075520 RepID=A0ABU3B2T9_9ACTN|nr:SsgA family sporulation/cell division regulator [Streptomyces sp. DSM 40712]MDT0616157.1 SsgA family sporulation/cell division regulator [Streptomyces sp. DSM 40712]